MSKHGSLRLCNFEHLHALSSPFKARSHVPTYKLADWHSLPPELLVSDTHTDGQVVCSPCIDMWALGCIMFEMLASAPPFKEQFRIAVLFRIFRTFGTPSNNILDYPTLMANEDFLKIMT